MELGDEWIYRLRVSSPSECVRILAIEQRKQTVRVDVEFLDGERAGVRDNVPGSRLYGPWSGVTKFNERMANWKRLGHSEIDEMEESAVGDVFDLLIPESVAAYYDSCVRNGATIRERSVLERLMQRPLSDVTDHVEWFENDDVLELSADGTLLIAEYVCAASPEPVLERIMTKEAEVREHCKRGQEYDALDGSGKRTSTPEREYEWYRRHHRPVHELLRAWCGHRSVTFVERLTAAEREVRRLDILVAKLVDSLRPDDKLAAEIWEREHDQERIGPETVRPIVDRPLAPWEIPVREVPVRRGRWW